MCSALSRDFQSEAIKLTHYNFGGNYRKDMNCETENYFLYRDSKRNPPRTAKWGRGRGYRLSGMYHP